MLFIGAGASTTLGIPDMRGMTKVVTNELGKRDPDYGAMLSEAIARLENSGIVPDIENLLGAMEASIDPDRVWDEVGSKIAVVMPTGKFKPLPHADKVSKLVEQMKLEIGKVCQNIDRPKAISQYKDLFDRVIGVVGNSFGAGSINVPNIFRTIVTTNYDVSLEYFFRRSNADYSEGFEVDGRNRLVFTGNWKVGVELIKIHGSISYTEEHGVLRQVEVPIGSSTLFDPIMSTIMIYPAGEKSISRRPYFDLYSKFRERLFNDNNILVVIGSSFRDIAIRNMIEDWLRMGTHRALLICSRSPKNHRSLFPNDLRDRVGTVAIDISVSGWSTHIAENIRRIGG